MKRRLSSPMWPYLLDKMLAQNGEAVRRNVVTGLFDSEKIVISEGLSAGESVITSWTSELKDGTKVYFAVFRRYPYKIMVKDDVLHIEAAAFCGLQYIQIV